MLSVDNFYWILHENLLRPHGVQCQYYYPWGTKDNLSEWEFAHCTSRSDWNHVLFGFDQEPIWNESLGKIYDTSMLSWGFTKWAKILANSEKSQLKSEICKQRRLLDWYFFYHGFAALDWFQDAQYVDYECPFQKAFLSFNHVFDQRAYRAALLARLFEHGIVHNGLISFHVTAKDIEMELCNPNTQLSDHSCSLIKNNMHRFRTDLPLRLDNVPIDGNLSARFGHQEYKLWQSALWHLVTETVFYKPKLHLTEKIFKPIVARRPFMLVAAPGNLAYLRSYGFQTFDRWVDESYDHMQDPDQRLDAIANEIARFARMSAVELQRIWYDMQPVLIFNKQHFFGKFREIIVSELVDNFEQCIRIWNNGRVDGRELLVHPDPESVKTTLLS